MALEEDHALNNGDVTSAYFIPRQTYASAFIVSRASGRLSGAAVAVEVFRKVDPHLLIEPLITDGSAISPESKLLSVSGDCRSILAAERTALNFLQHLSGVASLTEKFVRLVAGTKAKIVDTRKTLPGFRVLQKAAVLHGGGYNHRMALNDRILVKDNHLASVGKNPKKLKEIIQKIRQEKPGLLIEFEADSVDDALLFCELGADIILLDNMTTGDLSVAVKKINGRCLTEASGGVTLQNVKEIAQTGVDFISVGALTHSAPALDIGLDFK